MTMMDRINNPTPEDHASFAKMQARMHLHRFAREFGYSANFKDPKGQVEALFTGAVCMGMELALLDPGWASKTLDLMDNPARPRMQQQMRWFIEENQWETLGQPPVSRPIWQRPKEKQ